MQENFKKATSKGHKRVVLMMLALEQKLTLCFMPAVTNRRLLKMFRKGIKGQREKEHFLT